MRWLLHMPAGTIVHRSIGAAEPRRHECVTAWVAHYPSSTGFALAFGVGTVLVPWLVMQPSFGLGIASSRAPNPHLTGVIATLSRVYAGRRASSRSRQAGHIWPTPLPGTISSGGIRRPRGQSVST